MESIYTCYSLRGFSAKVGGGKAWGRGEKESSFAVVGGEVLNKRR